MKVNVWRLTVTTVLVLAVSALWFIAAGISVLPQSCFTRPLALTEIQGLEVDRCTFVWHGPAIQRAH